MIGAILGDIIGSPYEFDFNNIKSRDFKLFGPKSKDIIDMIKECRVSKEPLLAPKEYKPNYDSDKNVSDAIKLDLAEELFTKMMEEMETISIKNFLQHTMYLYDMSEYDILKDKRLID